MKKFTTKRNGQFPSFAVLCIAAIFSLVLLGCETESDTKPEGGAIFFTVHFSDSDGNGTINFFGDWKNLTDAQKAAVMSLTIAGLSYDPKTDGTRTLELKDGYRNEMAFDANGFQDYGAGVQFSVKVVRTPEEKKNTESTLTITNKKGYSFKPSSEGRGKFSW